MTSEIINECWRSIDGFVNYQVSNIGRVRNVTTGRILKPKNAGIGYLQIGLCADGRCHPKYIHRLVATEFIENPDGMEFVDHIDGNKTNNTVLNLRWADKRQNAGNMKKQLPITSSRYKGVCFERGRHRWRVSIRDHGRQLNLGYFDDEEEAARAYDAKAREVFGEFAKLNFPDE